MRRSMLVGTLVLAFAAGVAAQRGGGDTQTATLQKVRDNLFLIAGGGGNTAAFVTANGVVLVDTKLANWGPAIMEQVRQATDKPVIAIINTHTHGDHTGSNEFFPAAVEIVAQENTKANMQRMDAFKSHPEALPDRTFKDRLQLFNGADRIDLYYFGAGHTNGDALVVFPANRVMHSGDLFARKGTPLIDTNNGGSGVAYPETLKKAAAVIPGVDTVIPGHSAVATWKDFVEYGDFNQAFLAAVQQAIKAGKTADEAVAGFSLPARFSAYDMGGVKDNVGKIYAELKK